MLREQCRIGMTVQFGNPGGEMTRGRIVKLNGKTAKVETIDPRGRHAAGEVWRVGYGGLMPIDGEALPTVVPAAPVTIRFNPFDLDNPYYELLFGCYNRLSPENLTCDGEASRAQINRTLADTNRRIRGLCQAIGRNVSEDQLWSWWQEKQTWQQEHKRQVDAEEKRLQESR